MLQLWKERTLSTGLSYPKRVTLKTTPQVVKQHRGWGFWILLSVRTKRNESSSSTKEKMQPSISVIERECFLGMEKKSPKQENKRLQFEEKTLSRLMSLEEQSTTTSSSSKGSSRGKLSFQCYHYGGKNHLAQDSHTNKRSLS